MKQISKGLSTACLLTAAVFSSGVYATNLGSSDVSAIHSATFDGGAPAPDGNFIPAPTGTNVSFANVGTSNGGVTATGIGVVEYDGTTARLLSVLLPDMDITINNVSDTATVTTTGASITITGPDLDTEGNGQFQVDGGGSIVADFSTFPEVVLSCTELNSSGTICPGIPFLNLDGLKYQLDGTITPAGGDTLTLTLETNNGSVLVIGLVTTVPAADENVPLPLYALLAIGALLSMAGFAAKKRVA